MTDLRHVRAFAGGWVAEPLAVILSFLCLGTVLGIAQARAPSAPRQPPRGELPSEEGRIGLLVDDFEQGGSEKLDALDPSALTTELTKVFLERHDIHVYLVERSKIAQLLREGTLAQQYQGQVDPKLIHQLKLLQAQYIVFCKYHGMGDKFHFFQINARIVRVEDGTTVAAIDPFFPQNDYNALADLAYQLRKELLKRLNLPVPTSQYRLAVCSAQTIQTEGQADNNQADNKWTGELVTRSITQGLSAARLEDVRITKESADCSKSGGASPESGAALSTIWLVVKVMVVGQKENSKFYVYVWIENSSQERLASADEHICGFGELSEHMRQIADQLRERWATSLAEQ